MDLPTIWPQFFTSTSYNWKHVLKENHYKDIIISSLKHMASHQIVEINAFVVMNNHVHIIWQPLQHYSLTRVQTSFMTYTAKTIKKKLEKDNPALLKELKVNKYDRMYQIWKREPLSIELFTEKTFLQKLRYIHENPVSAGLVQFAEQYHYSSAKFYETGIDDFNMLTHYTGN